jgi:hypothetical protein
MLFTRAAAALLLLLRSHAAAGCWLTKRVVFLFDFHFY